MPRSKIVALTGEYQRGKYHCTIDLLFDWFEISCMTTDNFCFYLQNRLIQTSQTGGQWYSDTSPSSIPCFDLQNDFSERRCRGQIVELQPRPCRHLLQVSDVIKLLTSSLTLGINLLGPILKNVFTAVIYEFS